VNEYYMISIRRDSNDIQYHKANEDFQNEIDEFVNDRMNDIYNIIVEDKDTYLNEEGELDEKMKELTVNSNLIKRTDTESSRNKEYKFKFINENKDLRRNKKNLNKRKENLNKSLLNKINKKNIKDHSENNVEYIPYRSDLVKHICPVKNYYVVSAYLSDRIIDKVRQLPNVISIEKSFKELTSLGIINTESNYYNKEEILKETKWKGLGIQEQPPNLDFRYSHLSMLSQGKYYSNSSVNYDSNYYYPSSAGKGIDVYVIDDAFDLSLGGEEFDDYAGTSDKRTIRCDGRVKQNNFHLAGDNEDYLCNFDQEDDDIDTEHGVQVAISAVGKINGVAKKANLHLLSVRTDLLSGGLTNLLLALEYIQQNAKSYKTVINYSKNCNSVRIVSVD